MPNSKQELLIPMNHWNLVFSCEKTLRVLCLPKGFSHRDSFGAAELREKASLREKPLGSLRSQTLAFYRFIIFIVAIIILKN